jgi:O-antigen ligase
MFMLLLAIVVLSPLPFASVYPPAWLSVAVVVGGMLVVWSVQAGVGRRGVHTVHLSRIWLPTVLFAVPVVWASVQAIPGVPEALAHSIWSTVSHVLDKPLIAYVSVHPDATQLALIKLVTYASVFWLSLQYCRDSRRAKVALTVLCIAALVYSSYGIVAHFSGARTILWYAKRSYQFDLTSTFVNRNSYATYAGFGLLAATALLMQHYDDALHHARSRAEKLYALAMALTPRGALAAVTIATSLTALALTHSRAGFASTAAAMLTLLLVPAIRGKMRRAQVIALFIAVSIGVLGLLLSSTGEQLATRLAKTDVAGEERALVYERVIDGAVDHAWVGVGYGAFPHAWRLYRDEAIEGNYQMAHNVYLELAFELGIIPTTALLLSILLLTVVTLRGVRQRRRDFVYPGFALAATVLIALHSTVDFSMQIPAVALNYAFILGFGCSQSWRTS